jgi:hypothetical protein
VEEEGQVTTSADVSRFYLIRRKDTGEYFRPAKGPTWARRPAWTRDVGTAKAYGKIGNAKSARTAVKGDFVKGQEPDIELVEYKVIEVGVVV